MGRFHPIIGKIHLVLGLTCGLIASISGFTGSLYVWQPEIVAALNPELLRIDTIETNSEEQLLETSLKLYEAQKDSVVTINLPYREQESISVIYTNGQTLYYHPATGYLLGQKSASITFFENLLNIHRTLGIPDFGKYIVGGSAVLFFLFLLSSGLFLWWRKYSKKFKKGIKIKWTRPKKRLNYDIHKSLGFLFFLPLAISAFSGAYFTYVTYYKEGLKVLDPLFENNTTEQRKETEAPADIRELLKIPDQKYALRAVHFPQPATDIYHFRYIAERPVTLGLRKTRELKLDREGKVIQSTAYDRDAMSERIAAQFYPVHIGEIAGLPGRILIFIAGFVPLILFITGLRYYYFRKS